MRIIAGRFKGRRLEAFQHSIVRPTTDRVKETIFNKLMSYFPGCCVLDLFSGTGNLGLEALSRGAEKVVFVENNKKSLKILKSNIRAFAVENEVKVDPRDVQKVIKNENLVEFDLILIDPPFTKKLAHSTMEKLGQKKLQEGACVVIEASRHERIDDNYPGLLLLDRKDFGDKSVSFFKVEVT